MIFFVDFLIPLHLVLKSIECHLGNLSMRYNIKDPARQRMIECHYCEDIAEKLDNNTMAKCCIKRCNKYYCTACIQKHFNPVIYHLFRNSKCRCTKRTLGFATSARATVSVTSAKTKAALLKGKLVGKRITAVQGKYLKKSKKAGATSARALSLRLCYLKTKNLKYVRYKSHIVMRKRILKRKYLNLNYMRRMR